MAAAARIPTLYSYFLSACSWRVRNALEHKGIYYHYKSVDVTEDRHLREDFLKINPLAQVPVLLIDGHVLTHSTAILEYLEETVPEPPMLPKNPAQAAEVRKIVDIIAYEIQPLQSHKVLQYIKKDKFDWSQYWIRSGFESLERILQNTHGKYCVGDNVTLADMYLVPQVFTATIGLMKMSDIPISREIYSNLMQLSTFSAAHALEQPDYQTLKESYYGPPFG